MSSVYRVPPVQVSPTIKFARWGILMCGIVYGMWRRERLKVFEKTEHVIREQKIKEKYERLTFESKQETTRELMDVGKQFEITEFPPGWNDGF